MFILNFAISSILSSLTSFPKIRLYSEIFMLQIHCANKLQYVSLTSNINYDKHKRETIRTMADSTQIIDFEQRAQILIKRELGIEVPSYRSLRSMKTAGFVQFYLFKKLYNNEEPIITDVNHKSCRELVIIDQQRIKM